MAPGFVKVPGANHDSDRTGVLGDEELCMDSFGRPVHRERGVVCEREQSFEGFEVAFLRASRDPAAKVLNLLDDDLDTFEAHLKEAKNSLRVGNVSHTPQAVELFQLRGKSPRVVVV